MADDRYSWLDEEIAERLLRGLPVDAHDGGVTGPHDGPGTEAEAHAAARAATGRGHDGSGAPGTQPGRERPGGVPRDDAGAGRRGPGRSPDGARPAGRRAGGRFALLSDRRFRAEGRATAARLAAALDELAAAHTAPPAPAGGAPAELPGESAAVAAFRAARAARAATAPSGPAGLADTTPADGPPAAARPDERAGGRTARTRTATQGGTGDESRSRTRSLLTGRPLRAGFAVALAGCALGGVAVAAGTGVLPTPFTGKDTPAATVSPAATPHGHKHGHGPGTGEEETGAEGPDGGRDRTREPHDDRESGDGSRGDDSERGTDLAGGEGRPGKDHKDGRKDGHAGRSPGKGKAVDKQAVAAALCKAYADGKLEADDRRKLERAAGGRAVVRAFCARYGPSDGNGHHPGGNGGGQGGAPGGPGHGNGGSDGSSGGGGGHPPVPGDDSGGDTGGSDGTGGTGGAPSVPGDPDEGAASGGEGAVTGATSGQ
ncbi:hypothetical protein [Streptomyces albus]|uniref:hypothetical protein n=1 Tax=Streptomyces sp. NRRL F-5639 TaxID=1463867 RepID=UPI00068E520C|nr:hypothetical protein [Streptomyces sp. NRRL F-5639]